MEQRAAFIFDPKFLKARKRLFGLTNRSCELLPIHPWDLADEAIKPSGLFSKVVWRFVRWHYFLPGNWLDGYEVYVARRRVHDPDDYTTDQLPGEDDGAN